MFYQRYGLQQDFYQDLLITAVKASFEAIPNTTARPNLRMGRIIQFCISDNIRTLGFLNNDLDLLANLIVPNI